MRVRRAWLMMAAPLVSLSTCADRGPSDASADPRAAGTPTFRNVSTAASYVGDEACNGCHTEAAEAYRLNAMARSFHDWSTESRIETPLAEPVRHAATGLLYTVVDRQGSLYQEEYIPGPDGQRLHELSRRVDYVMGSGTVARTYFTEENGRLFQLPLTWYRERGWDFSPGYELNNARFGRLMPDRCLACHGSYPESIPFLEGKYAELPPGIGCERCHGPGELHVGERSDGSAPEGDYDDSIVNPRQLPFERRMDVCQQCHVHTPVTVLREGRDAFDFVPSQALNDHAAFFKSAGTIDIVSHADRLRQSVCFRESRATQRPLECSTCHSPHGPPVGPEAQSAACLSCHTPAELADRFASSSAFDSHEPSGDCVRCHMPAAPEPGIPHGSFTDHWIRVVRPTDDRTGEVGAATGLLEPYFERDRTGDDADLYTAMAGIVYASLASDAAVLREQADALSRRLANDTTRGEALFLLGTAYQQLGARDEAIDALERSLLVDPARPQRLHALAQLYEADGQEPEAIADLYRSALSLQPALAWIRADYADFLYARGRLEDAEAQYRTALEERPSLEVAWFNLGTLLLSGRRTEEAGRALREAVRLEPALADALVPLYEVLARANTIASVRPVTSPLETFPLRSRDPAETRIESRPGGRELAFVNVPAGATLRVVKPNGTLVRVLADQGSPVRIWDMRSDAGTTIGGGLYRVEVRAAGERAPESTRVIQLGIVRRGR